MEYTKLMSTLDDYLDQQFLVFYYDCGCIIKGYNATGVFESENGLELDDENYREYYACAIKVTEIIAASDSKICGTSQKALNEGTLIEISPEFGEPFKVANTDGELLWSRDAEDDK